MAAVAVAVPLLRDNPTTNHPPVAQPAPDDGTFVPGTDIDDQLQAAIGSALAALPTARDVYPSDWSRDAPLPDDQFADATEWQTYYDLSASDELLVYVSKPIPGLDEPPSCASNPAPTAHTCSEQQVAGGDLVTTRQTVGEPGQESYWFLASFRDADGRFVNVIEQVGADGWKQAEQRRVLTDADLAGVATAPGLDFPDPVNPPPAP